jgi:hypothetical protein
MPFSREEDSLCRDVKSGAGDKLAWILFPHLSNSQDCQPWLLDEGVRVRWARQAGELEDANNRPARQQEYRSGHRGLRATGMGNRDCDHGRRSIVALRRLSNARQRVYDPDGLATNARSAGAESAAGRNDLKENRLGGSASWAVTGGGYEP